MVAGDRPVNNMAVAPPQRLGSRVPGRSDGSHVLPELSESLGLGWSSGANSSVQRSMRRLIMFGLAHWSESFEVATVVPAVSERQLARMSPGLVRAHGRRRQDVGVGDTDMPDRSDRSVITDAGLDRGQLERGSVNEHADPPDMERHDRGVDG